MGYLSETNADNLEKVIARLPTWMQAKFAEHLKSLECKGRLKPNFKNVVDLLNGPSVCPEPSLLQLVSDL